MFNEVHKTSDKSTQGLVFIDSLRIKAYPCGRRRSELIDRDKNDDTVNDRYYIPYDPEARLNTELNTRKHSGLNGFAQTYIYRWEEVDKKLALVLDGYLFEIDLSDSATGEKFSTFNDFGEKIINKLTSAGLDTVGSGIYANIIIEETPLFVGAELKYNTEVLRDQSRDTTAKVCLDLSANSVTSDNIYEKYYFSGLSFSLFPRAGKNSEKAHSVSLRKNGDKSQRIVSLRILDAVVNENDTRTGWQLCQQALLPHIEHGDTEGSIKLDGIFAKDISAERFQLVSNTALIGSVPAVKVVYKPETDKYQLQFLFGKGNPAGGDADVPESGGDGGGGGDLMRKYGQLDVQYFILK
jgi:hypothetical protein